MQVSQRHKQRLVGEHNRLMRNHTNTNLEFELRYHVPDEATFRAILAKLQSSKLYRPTIPPRSITIATLWDDYRVIESENGNKIAQRKIQYYAADVDDAENPHGKPVGRISLAEEIDLSTSYRIPNNAIRRRRERYSFLSTSEPFRVDLTSITQQRGERAIPPQYELEVEWLNPSALQALSIQVVDSMLLAANSIVTSVRNEPSMREERFHATVDIKEVIREFNTLIHSEHPNSESPDVPISKPVDVTYPFLQWKEVRRYALTLKVDGVRTALFFPRGGDAYEVGRVITRLDGVTLTDDSIRPLILDGERMQSGGTNTYYAFDLIVQRGKYLPDTIDLLQRYERLLLIQIMIKGQIDVIPKKYYFYSDVAEYVSSLESLNESRKGAVPTDGFIFQQLDPGSLNAYKWKPPDTLTLDFIVDPSISPYVFFIRTSDRRRVPASDVAMGMKPALLPRDTSAFKRGSANIAEFKWSESEQRFEYYRMRPDKEYPNAEGVVKGVFALMRDPITFDTLSLMNLTLTRKYHNREKMAVYEELAKLGVKSIADVGSGTGGDVAKWRNLGLEVTAIEVNPGNFARLEKRIGDMGYRHKAKAFNADASAFTPPKLVDAVTSFNSLTFFAQDDARLDAFLARLSGWLKPGGYLALMFVDGPQLRRYFPPPRYQSPLISITYDPIVRNKIRISIAASGIVSEQDEYLVDAKRVEANPRIRVMSVRYLDEEPLQSQDGERLSLSTAVVMASKRDAAKQPIIGTRILENEGKFAHSGDSYHLLPGQGEEYPRVSIVMQDASLIATMLGAFFIPYIDADEAARKEMVKKVEAYMQSESLSTASFTDVGTVFSLGILHENKMYALPQNGDYVMVDGSPGNYRVVGVLDREKVEVVTVHPGDRPMSN